MFVYLYLITHTLSHTYIHKSIVLWVNLFLFVQAMLGDTSPTLTLLLLPPLRNFRFPPCHHLVFLCNKGNCQKSDLCNDTCHRRISLVDDNKGGRN